LPIAESRSTIRASEERNRTSKRHRAAFGEKKFRLSTSCVGALGRARLNRRAAADARAITQRRRHRDVTEVPMKWAFLARREKTKGRSLVRRRRIEPCARLPSKAETVEAQAFLACTLP
jgi:hypothetical protein